MATGANKAKLVYMGMMIEAWAGPRFKDMGCETFKDFLETIGDYRDDYMDCIEGVDDDDLRDAWDSALDTMKEIEKLVSAQYIDPEDEDE